MKNYTYDLFLFLCSLLKKIKFFQTASSTEYYINLKKFFAVCETYVYLFIYKKLFQFLK